MKKFQPGVIGYCRVSTSEQAEHGVSLAAQQVKIRQYCRLHELNLGDIHIDRGISGRSLDARPSAQECLRMMQGRLVSGIVISKLDRWCRSTRDALDLFKLCAERGVTLHVIDEKIDSSTAHGAFLGTLLAALGELEARVLGERTAAALRHLRSIGRATGGHDPIGFRSRRVRRDGRMVRVLVAVPAEQATVALVHRLRRRGKSLRAIARDLTLRGIPTKLGRQVWHPEMVRTALRSPVKAA